MIGREMMTETSGLNEPLVTERAPNMLIVSHFLSDADRNAFPTGGTQGTNFILPYERQPVLRCRDSETGHCGVQKQPGTGKSENVNLKIIPAIAFLATVTTDAEPCGGVQPCKTSLGIRGL